MSCYISEVCYCFIVAVECVITVVHYIQAALSMHASTAVHYVFVWHLHTVDTVLT
jgi:hypothetical protein